MSELSPPLASILASLIEERTGLHYSGVDSDLLLEKVRARAEDAGFPSLLDYYYFLRYEPDSAGEMDALVDALVVPETYFFRELEPLRFLISSVLLPHVRRGEHPRVWSAACASGEEPLTLAMLLAEEGLLGQVSIVASDISQMLLDRARSGRFGGRSLRDPVPEAAQRWLTEVAGGWQIAPELVAAVEWRRLNLTEREHVAAIGPCDVILCRNVLIYFSDPTARHVLASLSRVLKPGGLLFVGVSESLLRFGTTLRCEERSRVFFYRKEP